MRSRKGQKQWSSAVLTFVRLCQWSPMLATCFRVSFWLLLTHCIYLVRYVLLPGWFHDIFLPMLFGSLQSEMYSCLSFAPSVTNAILFVVVQQIAAVRGCHVDVEALVFICWDFFEVLEGTQNEEFSSCCLLSNHKVLDRTHGNWG